MSVLRTLALALSITSDCLRLLSPIGPLDTCLRKLANIEMYSTIMNKNAKKKTTPTFMIAVKRYQKLFGHFRKEIQMPSDVKVVVGIDLARLKKGPKSHAITISMNTCFFMKEVL